MCTHLEPHCRQWFFGAKQLSVHYKMEHGVFVCAECGHEFAGQRRIDEHFDAMEMYQQQQQEDEAPDDDDSDDDDSDSEPSTAAEVEPSSAEEEEEQKMDTSTDEDEDSDEQDSSGTEVGFSWR